MSETGGGRCVDSNHAFPALQAGVLPHGRTAHVATTKAGGPPLG